MINPYLKSRLRPAWQRLRGWQFAARTAGWLVLAALAGLLVYRLTPPHLLPRAVAWWGGITLAGLTVIVLVRLRARPDYRSLAGRIEARHPALDGRLLTAVQVEDSDELAFIRERLLQQTLQHGLDHDWTQVVGMRKLQAVQALCVVAAGACAAVLLGLPDKIGAGEAGEAVAEAAEKTGVEVTPGDTEVEKGTSLLVMARFTGPVPGTAELVTGNTPETESRQFLARSLNDPMFGGSVPGVQEDFRYRVDYDGRRSPEFSVKVFEYPALERSDLTLTFPEWTGLPEKRTEDTKRVSAVEGTTVRLDLQLNKPVASALLKARDREVPDISLEVDPAKATAVLRGFIPKVSQVYDLRLTDADQRDNRTPAVFHIEVLPNQPPVIRLASPKGDQRPSALEEMRFEGTVADDFGLLTWGMTFGKPGEESVVVELGRDGNGAAPREFRHLLSLEEQKMQPDDLIAWHVWADDIGPDGKPRRTRSDLFYGEVRPFEEIFRQGEEAAGGAPPPPGGAGPGEAATQVAELQKQITNATWKLMNGESPPATDLTVVKDSQQKALSQAEAAAEEVRDARLSAAWAEVQSAMSAAIEELEQVIRQSTPLTKALEEEQKAQQALLAVRARETVISRNKNQAAGQSASEQERQMELDEMDLTEDENRYELERSAEAPQDTAQQEQRQVLSRLQELARRQEEVNAKLKELQTALQAAPDEEQREELKRELKRLEEEQRQMLADVDELNQRMEQPENQSRMAEEKAELEKARAQVQESAKAAAEGNVAQALSAGTRAERQLQEMREDLRKKSSDAFTEELRDMRAEARQLASRQQEVKDQLERLDGPDQQRTLSDSPEREAARQRLEDQQKRAEALTQRAAGLSEAAEGAEPLVSRQIYDSMREFSQEDAANVKQTQERILREGRMTRQFMDELNELQQSPEGARTLEMTSSLLAQDMVPDAQEGAGQALEGIEQFRKGIEKAAESVLGDDTEALKRADRELEDLAEELEKEIAQASGTQPGERGAGEPGAGTSGEAEPGRQPGESQEGGEPGGPPEGTARAAGQGGSQPGEGETAGNPPGPGRGEAGDPELAQNGGEREGQAGTEGTGEEPGQGEGQGQGQGEGEGEGQGLAEGQSQSPGQGRGQGEGQGLAQGEGEGQGQGEGQGAGQGQGEGEGQGQGEGRGQGEGLTAEGSDEGQGNGSGGGPGGRQGGNRVAGGRGGSTAPMTGDGYAPWSDRLRDVEEIVEFPDLRNDLANARERARVMRVEMKRDLKKPDWAVVRSEIVKPLVEVRQRVREELARRESSEALVPIDRDPVPGRYAEQVRRYYEQLGREP